MKKQNLLIGLVLFLVVTNVATILTVARHINKQDKGFITNRASAMAGDTAGVPGTQRVKYMAEQLGLSSDQQDSFRNATWEYGRKAQGISQKMSRLRDLLLIEMDKDTPDTTRLSQLSEQIGFQHTNLKKLSVDHYLVLKSFCMDDQKKELFEMFEKVLKPDGEVSMPRGQGPPGRGRGGPGKSGRGPWWQNQKDSVSSK
ncbi:MAG: hypothetical protein A2X22_13950 [Bacteroidetes bacterium GWF2_49_14]|nr:MAG: hypothetical protein A2X22_13950 [Bacteroidetes bacterium GWF2_49_14]HBB90231.1 hypothetical protein [Bacteroidales bacterium]